MPKNTTTMRVLAAVVLALAALAAVAHGQSTKCGAACYLGTITWGSSPANTLDFSFTLLACAPPRILSPLFALNGVMVPLGAQGATFHCIGGMNNGTEAALTVSFGVGNALNFVYATTQSCADLTADIGSMAGSILYTQHLVEGQAVPSGAALNSFARACPTSGTCDPPVTYQTGFLTFAGTALQHSACGAQGQTLCYLNASMTLSDSCTAPLVDALDVVAAPSGVALSTYNPQALDSPVFNCANSMLAMYAAGVTLAWAAPTDNSADCPTLLANLRVLATGALYYATVTLQTGEQWTVSSGPSIAADSVQPGEPTTTPPSGSVAMTTTTTTTGDGITSSSMITSGGGVGDLGSSTSSSSSTSTSTTTTGTTTGGGGKSGGGGGGAGADTVNQILAPVTPSVVCSLHLGDGACCTLFSVTNPNAVGVSIAATRGKNSFLPAPFTYVGQPIFFPADTTFDYAVAWNCSQYLRLEKRWILATHNEDLTRNWVRTVTVSHSRNDCPTNYC